MGPNSAAAAFWARADLRARWRSLVVLGLLAGITAGFGFAAVAGARRTATAMDRLRSRTHAADAAVFASQSGVAKPDWSKLAARPEIATLAPWALVDGVIDGEFATLFAPVGNTWTTAVDRPVVIKGRMFRPYVPGEMVITKATETQDDVKLGDVGKMKTISTKQKDFSQGPQGPVIPLRVVGVVKVAGEFTFAADQAILSPATLTKYKDMATFENAFVTLRRGSKGMPALQRDVNKYIASGTPVLDTHNAQRRVDTTVDVQHAALLLIALAIAAAGFVLVGQAIARSAAAVERDAMTLRATGMTRPQVAGAGARPHILSAVVAMVSAFVTAVVASRFFPIGLIGRVDPNRGFHVDWTVLGFGVLALGVIVIAAAAFVAFRVSATPRTTRARRGTGTLSWVRRNAPVTVGVGATMTFEPPRTRSAFPTRPALIGAVVGVLGVVATMTIDRGLNDSLAHPERAGVTWDITVGTEHTPDTPPTDVDPKVTSILRENRGVAGATIIDRALVDVDDVGVPTFTFRKNIVGAPHIKFTTIKGHAPDRAGEATIGPRTAHVLGVGVGDTVKIGEHNRRVRIVGESLFPSDVHAEFDEGLLVTVRDFDAVVPLGADARSGSGADRMVAVDVVPGANAQKIAAGLGAKLGDLAPDGGVAEVPLELSNLKNVRSLPVLLAVFLAVLAIAAVAFALFTSARARAGDFAVLRALGLTRRGTRSVVHTQGTILGLLGVVVGVPVGIVLGRSLWRVISARIPLENIPPFTLAAVVLVVPLALLLVNLVAWWPGRRVAHVDPADVLRTE